METPTFRRSAHRPAIAGAALAFFAALSLFGAAGTVRAQTEAATEPATEAAASTVPMEEVIVRGQRSVLQLRSQAKRATREFYNLLNNYMDEPDFKIRCFRGRPPAGGAVQQICRTAYQERAARNLVENVTMAAEFAEDVPIHELMLLYDNSLQVAQRSREFNDAVLTAINTHPELNKAARDLIALRRRVAEAQMPARSRREQRD